MEMLHSQHIVLAEEDDQYAFILQLAFKQAGFDNPVDLLTSDDEVIDYLSRSGRFADRAALPLPIGIILALRLPLTNDFKALRWIHDHPQFSHIPVTVLSGFEYDKERAVAHQLGAQCYEAKPSDFPELVRIAREIRDRCLQPQSHSAAA